MMLHRLPLRAVLPALVSTLIFLGCQDSGPIAPSLESGPGFQALTTALTVQDQHTDRLLGIDGVVGTATGLSADGEPAVLIFTLRPGVAGIPPSLEGIPVVVRVTGPFLALHHRPGHGGGPGGPGGGAPEPSTTDRWPRPVPIGISTGNAGECSAGTLGARVRSGASVFALSNNHVYALENQAPIGSNVLQPGRFDTNCATDPNDVIGQLHDFEPIVFSSTANNTVDAAIASTTTANLGNATPADGYGVPKSAIVSAALDQPVQKYGRTTQLTKGVVTGVNATVKVGYSSGTARFVDQIIVQAIKPFIKPGDSGSLLVTDPGRNPVGLLFAGDNSGKFAVANRIDLVLQVFNVTMDGE